MAQSGNFQLNDFGKRDSTEGFNFYMSEKIKLILKGKVGLQTIIICQQVFLELKHQLQFF